MHIIIGSGNRRQSFEITTGKPMKALAKSDGVEHAKIVGNLKALVRRQPAKTFTKEAFAKMQEKNERKRSAAA